MLNLRTKLKQTLDKEVPLKEAFQSENGAIDLASIMVGIIVIGMIGGVIAATVFAVIPWSQDNAAKQQLDSIVAAESAYMGLSSTNPPSLPAGLAGNSYGNSNELETAGLLKAGPRYCASTANTDPSSYEAFSQSSSGKIWSATDKVTKPVIFTGTLPTDCQFITAGVSAESPTTPPVAYADATPTKTILTYRCDTAITGEIPMRTNLTGTETWSDGTTRTYTNSPFPGTKTLLANTEYVMTFEGTYTKITNNLTTASNNLAKCLVKVNHWGRDTGVTDAKFAFAQSSKLIDVPANLPPTVTNLNSIFRGATVLNDSDVSNWNTTSVTDMGSVFSDVASFDQPLNDWNTVNVINMGSMFYGATAFNQPLNNWNTSNVTNMSGVFQNTANFNQALPWTVSNVTRMNSMFSGAAKFNQPLNWDTSNVVDMGFMFSGATIFNQNIKAIWNVSKVTSSVNFRLNSALTAANSPF